MSNKSKHHNLSLKKPEILFLSFFGVGFFPKAPGTAGTIACLPILYLFSQLSSPVIFFIPLLIIVTATSCFIAEYVQKDLELHDPSWIVIDEVLGMTVAWLFQKSPDFSHLFLLFLLFRLFDIKKIWPATFFDQKVLHGSGTILDDIISGLYAGVAYLIILVCYKSLIGS